ncbi:MAG: class F sortase [Thermogemmatispora sp.]|uniref:class F sortase n=1 Tax=Thermogemmatispora sp. TaxID=1968838 RepID=UPI00260E3BFC|nr:class F sortase [Thermogemmatispora sp.]MBX5458495.1 class F sortase [Thermogemmatispora sp.]
MQRKAQLAGYDGSHLSSGVRRWRLFLLLTMLVSSGLLVGGCGMASPPAPAVSARPAADGRVERPPPATAAAPATALTPAPPARLLIPAIGVEAAVERVGLAADGTLATPQRRPWDDVGWYSLGALPGQQGSAVIAGHLDRPGGYPAVFWNLHLLRPGTPLTVIDERGQRWHFRVTAVASYPPEQAPLLQIFADRSGHYLNLITCAGSWIPSEHQTTERLVVYSVLQGG